MTVLMLGLTRKRGAVAEEQVFAATPRRAHLTNWPGAAQILQLIIYNKEKLIFQKCRLPDFLTLETALGHS